MRIITNASPLIVLCKSRLEYLLPQLCEEVLVPAAVWDEVIAGGANDPAALALPNITWTKRVEVTMVNPVVRDWNLGAGESGVLNLACTLLGHRVMIDDAAARDCAKTLGIPFIGTGGLLVLAKQRGLIASVSDALNVVTSSGLWLSDQIIALLKARAGE
jgi:predicted nucleic acid-binding protein